MKSLARQASLSLRFSDSGLTIVRHAETLSPNMKAKGSLGTFYNLWQSKMKAKAPGLQRNSLWIQKSFLRRKRIRFLTKLCHFAPPPLGGRGKMAELRLKKKNISSYDERNSLILQCGIYWLVQSELRAHLNVAKCAPGSNQRQILHMIWCLTLLQHVLEASEQFSIYDGVC